MCKVLECTTAVVLRPFTSRVVVFKQHSFVVAFLLQIARILTYVTPPLAPGTVS